MRNFYYVKLIIFLSLFNQLPAQNNFYQNPKYEDAKTSFHKGDFKRLKKIVKKQLSKKDYQPIFINIADLIINQIDSEFASELTADVNKVINFTNNINQLHQQKQFYDIYISYKNCSFLDKLPPSSYYIVLGALEKISYDEYLVALKNNLKANGNHFRAAWSVGYLSFNIGLGYKLWSEIENDAFFDNYKSIKSYTTHLKENIPDIQIDNWDNYVKLYGVLNYIETNPNDGIAYRKLGHIYKALHRNKEAKEAFLTSYKLDPFYFNGNSLRDAIVCTYLLEDDNEAKILEKKYKQQHFSNPEKELLFDEQLVTVYIDAGLKNKARNSLNLILKKNISEKGIIQLASLMKASKHNQEALQLYKKLPRKKLIQNLEAYNDYLQLLVTTENYDDFTNEFEFFNDEELIGNYTTYSKFYSFFNTNKEYEIALEILNQGIKNFPNATYLLAARAYINLQLKQLVEAKQDAYRCLKIDPNYYWSYSTLKSIADKENENFNEIILKVLKNQPYSYLAVNKLLSLEKKQDRIPFLNNLNIDVSGFNFIKAREIYYASNDSKSNITFFKEELAKSKSPLDSIYYLNILGKEYYYHIPKNKVSKSELNQVIKYSNLFNNLYGDKVDYHYWNAFTYRSLGKTNLMVEEAINSVKANPNDIRKIKTSIIDLKNNNGFVYFRKLINKDFYNYDNLTEYIRISTLYGGGTINAVWAYEKCKETFPNSSCNKRAYNIAIEKLGFSINTMKDYKKQTSLGNTKRYIDWYNNTRKKMLSSQKEVLYDKEQNKITTIDKNGEISITKQDPFTGKTTLKQKGKVWIKYQYTPKGDLSEISTSSNKKINLMYDEENKIREFSSNTDGVLNFTYNKYGKPIKIVLNSKDTLNVEYDDKQAIKKVSSGSGHTMALKITQMFQNLLSYTRSFDFDDIKNDDKKSEKVKNQFEDAQYNLKFEETELNEIIINAYNNYLNYLRESISYDALYSKKALDISFEMNQYLQRSISNDLKIKILEFSNSFYEILNDIRKLGVANDYWDKWNTILEILEVEKNKQNSLNPYRKKIESLLSKFRKSPINLLAKAEWLPKSSFSNDAYWISTELEKVYKEYDFSKTPVNHIIKRSNGDLLMAFDQGIAVKQNGFWKFLYYDTLNKKLIQNQDLIKIKSKTTFNYFTELPNKQLVINTSKGLFTVGKSYKKLKKIKISSDNYIGNNSCKMFNNGSYLYLYNSNAVNILTYKDNDFKLDYWFKTNEIKLKKVSLLNTNNNKIKLIALTDKGLSSIILDSSKNSSFKSFVNQQNIKDFLVFNDERSELHVYFIFNNSVFKKSISNISSITSTVSKPLELKGNLLFNKEIIGFCKVPIEKNNFEMGVISDTGINIYRDYHFEFFKIPSKSGLDEFTSNYFCDNFADFGIVTKQKLLHFSLANYYYDYRSKPTKIKALPKNKVTLTLKNRNLYFMKGAYTYQKKLSLNSSFGTRIYDFDVSNNEEVYVAEYKSVYKITFNDDENNDKSFSVKKLFTIEPHQVKKFKSNNGIKQVKIADDGTVWVTTELSIFRYNANHSTPLKEFNYFKNNKEFPAKSFEIFNIIKTYNNKILIANSSESWNDYNGVDLDGGLVIYNENEDKFQFLSEDKNKPDFPWFFTSYTKISENEGILGTSSGFAYHSKGGIRSYKRIDNRSYVDIEKKYKNLFLGTEGTKFGDFYLFGCAEGVLAFKDNQWFYPERLNQLLPKFSEHGKWGGNKVNAIEVDHLQRLNIATDLGLLVINANQIDPFDLLLMNRDINKTIEYFNIDKLQKEREKLISNLPNNSETKKVVEKVKTLKDKIFDLQKSKISYARDFKLKETGFKTINIDSVNSEINKITKQHSSLLLTLKEKNPVIYQTLKVPPLDIASIRGRLKSNECIVQYIPLTNKLILQIVTKQKLILKEVSVTKKELYNLSLIASDLLSNKKLVRGTVTNEPNKEIKVDLNTVLEQLYNNLISPIEADIKPFKNNIQVIAEGALNYIPFESLVYKDGKDKVHFAIENFKFTYLTSLYMWKILFDFPELEPSNYLLVGDPDSSLPHARKEVEEIAQKLSNNPTVLIGNKAKLKAFKKSINNKGVIHLATHGFIDRKTIRDSWLLFSDTKLKLSEVYELNLDKTKLLVLSACESGLGKDGIETTSLSRAFANAGVQNLVASLWKVNDESTKILMNKFYDNIKDGANYSNALHNAQKHLISFNGGQFKSPKYWAPFILIGKN